MTLFKFALALAVLATVASSMKGQGSPVTVGSGDSSVKGLAEGTGQGLGAGTGVGTLQRLRFRRATVPTHSTMTVAPAGAKPAEGTTTAKLAGAHRPAAAPPPPPPQQAQLAPHGGKTTAMRELDSITSMSFVPTEDEIKELIKQSKAAEKLRLGKVRSKLLSKLVDLPPKLDLCPKSLDPNDTLLAKMGRTKGTIGDKDTLTFIADRNMPLGGSSAGPNGVLTDCQNTFGKNRMNLFYESKEKTKALLDGVLKARNANANALFGMYCDSLNNFRTSFKKDPTKNETIPQELHADYTNVCDMFTKLQGALKESNDLATVGLGVNSFCQTWLRKGSKVGDAQFSVMSPLFQTRHFIADDAKVSAILGEKAKAQLASYKNMLDYFDKDMSKPYGVQGGGQAFVNLDKLAASGALKGGLAYMAHKVHNVTY